MTSHWRVAVFSYIFLTWCVNRNLIIQLFVMLQLTHARKDGKVYVTISQKLCEKTRRRSEAGPLAVSERISAVQ